MTHLGTDRIDMVSGSLLKVAGIGELVVSNNPKETLVTYSLGSCVGVVFFDPVVKVGALIHCMLPSSKLDLPRSIKEPELFVDTGLLFAVNELVGLGAQIKNIECKITGGASPLKAESHFQVGVKNVAITRRFLQKNNIQVTGEYTGGSDPVSTFLEIKTGKVWVKIGRDQQKIL